ncbi:MAG: ribosome maturation factor RimP [Gemmatimonadota bacterium]|nr:ribosome maturation factor RimP [Gemmatimonadota bacterium]
MAKIERTIEDLGFEVVTLDQGGGRRRPLLRIRIDRPDSPPGRSSVGVDDCAAVTRALREVLDAEEGGEERDWVLEVSSPGVERPLTKARDYERFSGERIRVRGYGPLAGRGKQLEGTLLGLVDDRSEMFGLEIEGERVEIALDAVASARLVVSWDEELRAPSPGRRET